MTQPASTTDPERAALTVAAFRALAATSSAAELLLETGGKVVAANQPATELLGCEAAELEGSDLRRWVAPPDDDLDELLRPMSRTSAALPAALTVQNAGGSQIPCRAEGGRVTRAAAAPLLVLRLRPRDGLRSEFSLLTEQVIELRREVARRQHAELLLEHQKGLLELIVGDQPLPALLRAIAEFIEEHSDRCLCSILLLSEDGERLQFGAAPSLPSDYNAAIDDLEIGPDVGSCGTAAFLGESVTVSDIASDPRWENFRDLAAEHGLAACWSWPVTGSKGEVLGTLAMYYRQPMSPSDDDLYLTSLGVDLTAIAILRERSRSTLIRRAEQLAEADRRKDRFLAMLSHELRNPLAPIVNTLSILAESDNPELLEHVARLERQTTHLSRLVDDLLDLSRIAHGSVELKVERVDLRGCLAQAVDSVTDLIDERGQTFEMQAASEPVWVDGDSDRLRQVFSNLLGNACKYTPPGGRIEVELKREERMAVCRVRDNGQGLSAEIRERLFEPFIQGAQSAVDSREGLGLGLTLVKQLVECHNGAVGVESAGEGLGSEFTVRLPLSASAEGYQEAPVEPSGDRVRSLDILLAEDNRDSAEALKILLELWGHKPRVCYDGDSAVTAAMTHQPDVLLLDIDLPGRDGYSVLRELRRQGFAIDRRMVVAMTGFGRLRDMETSAREGFHHHLTKPADPTALRRLLAEFSASGSDG